jgi:hypothetical protein
MRRLLLNRRTSELVLRLEYRELALHERIAVARERQAILGLEVRDLAAVHYLPRPLMSDVIRQTFKLAVSADDEHVVVGCPPEVRTARSACEGSLLSPHQPG